MVEAQQEVDECGGVEAGEGGLVLLEVGGWEENAEFIGPIFLLAYLNPARLRLGFFVREGRSALIIILLGWGIVFSAGIVNFVVESVVTGSAIGQSLLGSGKGVEQSGPFTVGNRPCDGCRAWRSSRCY